MGEHTPGPWRHGRLDMTTITEREVKFVYGPGNSPNLVAMADCSKDEWRANARLIAAAPELLEALRELPGRDPREGLPCWCGAKEPQNHHDYCMKARAAIAKAEGRDDD
jgi:hypothetical protein